MQNEYTDKLLNCRECGTDFIFTGREQDFYAQKGFDHEPTRCVQCRNVRRRERTVQPVGAAPARNYAQFQPGYNHNGNSNGNNNGNGNYANSRPTNSNPVRTGGISNGQRSSSYGNRQFGPNYSTLGRSSNNGNTTRPSSYSQPSNNGNYNRVSGPISNGYHNTQVNYQERKMYPIVCVSCGISTEVPFTPREGAPVFCRTCYNNQKNSR